MFKVISKSCRGVETGVIKSIYIETLDTSDNMILTVEKCNYNWSDANKLSVELDRRSAEFIRDLLNEYLNK